MYRVNDYYCKKKEFVQFWPVTGGWWPAHTKNISNSIYFLYFSLRFDSVDEVSKYPIKDSLRFFLFSLFGVRVIGRFHIFQAFCFLLSIQWQNLFASFLFTCLSKRKFSKYLEFYLLSKAMRSKNGAK